MVEKDFVWVDGRMRELVDGVKDVVARMRFLVRGLERRGGGVDRALANVLRDVAFRLEDRCKWLEARYEGRKSGGATSVTEVVEVVMDDLEVLNEELERFGGTAWLVGRGFVDGEAGDRLIAGLFFTLAEDASKLRSLIASIRSVVAEGSGGSEE